ncbi:MAG: hypothetical protein R3B55_00900 [Candidatus Paceibacterota bacterium]
MDTDKKTDANNITGGEKDTLHNAGVDLSSAETEPEEFIEIDNMPAIGDDPDLKKIGLELAPKENKEDLSLLKEQMDNKAVANTSPNPNPPSSVFKDEQKPAPEVKAPEPKETKEESPKPEKDSDISDLEKEFNQTVGQSSAPKKSESLNEKISSLEAMLIKIKEKLGFKKVEVKEELESLKRVKEDIEEDIENIKELEESKDKIESQLSKVEAIKGEISSIEKEVEEELKS